MLWTVTALMQLTFGDPASSIQENARSDRESAVAKGAVIAERNCGGCHSVGPFGPSPRPPAPPLRELSARYPVADLVGAIGEGAPTGHPQMPRFQMPLEDSRDLVAYVLSLQRPNSQVQP